MKLCLVIDSLRMGGAERVVVTLADHWASLGWQVSVATVRDPETDHFRMSAEVNRVDLGGRRRSAGRFSAVEKAFPLWGRLGAVIRLRRYVQSTNPSIVMSHLTKMNVATWVALMGTRATIVGTEHSYPPTIGLGTAWRGLRRLVIPKLSHVSVLTDDTAEWLRREIGVHRIGVIPNPLRFPIPTGEPVVPPFDGSGSLLLAVGRLLPVKGFDLLIDAFAVLAQQHPDWKLVILGEGPERSALEEQVRAHGLAERVEMPGMVGNVGDWYATADLLVMTSRAEGLPMVLIEALASGCPAVAVDCMTGPRDILRHEVDGLLVPENDQESLIQGLDRLMSDRTLRELYAQRAVEVRTRFSTAQIAGQYEQLFQKLI
jgi:glycosyltransferase involved in cell wall biosynthesis